MASGDRPLHFLVHTAVRRNNGVRTVSDAAALGPVYISGGTGVAQNTTRYRPSLSTAEQTVAAPTDSGTATVGPVTVVSSLIHVLDSDDGIYRFVFKGTGDVTNSGTQTVILTLTLPSNVKLTASAVIAGSGCIAGAVNTYIAHAHTRICVCIDVYCVVPQRCAALP